MENEDLKSRIEKDGEKEEEEESEREKKEAGNE